MTIHDELIYDLTQPDKEGKIPLHEIVKKKDTVFKLEETFHTQLVSVNKLETITPDVFVIIGIHDPIENRKHILIELESDITWDFGKSLRQIKKYRRYRWKDDAKYEYDDFEVYVIIPKGYEKYAKLYQNEGINVWLWTTMCVWECKKCVNVWEEEIISPRIHPKCPSQKCNHNQHYLLKAYNSKFESA